jgi:translin
LTLKKILQKIRKELKAKNELREKMLNNSRKIARLSKQAIIQIHQEKLEDAQKKINEAKSILSLTNKALKNTPELQYSGALMVACQELAEASILLKLEKEGVFPTPSEINVSSASYALGLADAIGEFRRKTLDSMRKGEVETSEKYLKLMEDMYGELMLLDEHVFSLLPGLRRKCDSARHLIETTRADVIIETRRKLLEESIKFLEKKVGKKA